MCVMRPPGPTGSRSPPGAELFVHAEPAVLGQQLRDRARRIVDVAGTAARPRCSSAPPPAAAASTPAPGRAPRRHRRGVRAEVALQTTPTPCCRPAGLRAAWPARRTRTPSCRPCSARRKGQAMMQAESTDAQRLVDGDDAVATLARCRARHTSSRAARRNAGSRWHGSCAARRGYLRRLDVSTRRHAGAWRRASPYGRRCGSGNRHSGAGRPPSRNGSRVLPAGVACSRQPWV